MLASVGRKRIAQRLGAALSNTGKREAVFRPASRLIQDPARSYLSTESTRYAVVDHSEAYEAAMQGRHGKQLSLAKIDGVGKDDPPFDPFLEYGIEEPGDTDNRDTQLEAEWSEAEPSSEADLEDEEEDEIDVDDELPPYNNDGSLQLKKSQLAEFRAGAPAGGMFAILELGGTQHKVTVDDVIVSSKLKPVDTYCIGSVHTLRDILLVGSSHLTLVGMPSVAGAEVDVMVEEIARDEKVIIFKKRRRKNSKRKNGFRRDVTLLRVLDIRMPEAYSDHNHTPRVPVCDES